MNMIDSVAESIGLDDDQAEPLRKHIAANGVHTRRVDWGRPTLVVRDLDANEIFFWLPQDDFTDLGVTALESSGNHRTHEMRLGWRRR